MALPNNIKIGPITYVVKEIEDLHTVDDDGRKKWLHGHIQFADVFIKVGSDQDEQMKLTTIWHEALHGILHQAGYREHPENMIEALGYGLVQLLRDNPELVTLTVGYATGGFIPNDGTLDAIDTHPPSTIPLSVNGNQPTP